MIKLSILIAASVLLGSFTLASAADVDRHVSVPLEGGELVMTAADGAVLRCSHITFTGDGKPPAELAAVRGMIQVRTGDVTLRVSELHFPAEMR